MKLLTAEQVLFIHNRIVAETGGSHGVRDLGLLLSAVARPLAGYGDVEAYPDLSTKAAALLDSLIHNHPFVDGNKRTAITATGLFLELNGRILIASNPDLEEFAVHVTTTKPAIASIAEWLEAHSQDAS